MSLPGKEVWAQEECVASCRCRLYQSCAGAWGKERKREGVLEMRNWNSSCAWARENVNTCMCTYLYTSTHTCMHTYHTLQHTQYTCKYWYTSIHTCMHTYLTLQHAPHTATHVYKLVYIYSYVYAYVSHAATRMTHCNKRVQTGIHLLIRVCIHTYHTLQHAWHTATHVYIQPIAFGVSFYLNLQSQSHWSLLNGTWQKRPRELDYWLRFERNDTPNAIGCTCIHLRIRVCIRTWINACMHRQVHSYIYVHT